MIFGYLVAFLRHLRKHWNIALLNTLSYGIGIAACIIIAQYIVYETSYDKFHKDYQKIFRVQLDHFYSNVHQNSTATSFYPVGPQLKKRYPQVEAYTMLSRIRNAVVTVGENTFLEEIFLTDSTFFNVFDLKMIKGDHEIVNPQDLFISETAAAKYFGTDNPIGNTIRIDRRMFPIKGVFKDLPATTHVKYDILRIRPGIERASNNWANYEWYTYIALNDNPDLFDQKLKNFSEEFSSIADQQSEVEYKFRARLQPLASIHLESHTASEFELNGNIQDVYILLVVAVMIFIISCFNYVNMTNVINADRTKESFIRKIHGASGKDTLIQHIVESFVLNVLGFVVATIFLLIFSGRIGAFLSFPSLEIDWANPLYYYGLLIIFIISFILSGVLPAILSSTSNLAQFLNRSSTSQKGGERFSKNIAIIQFIISYVLISGALMVTKQLRFMNDKDIGLNPNGVVLLTIAPLPYSRIERHFKKFKDDLEKEPSIKKVSFSTIVPGEKLIADASFKFSDDTSEDSKFCFIQQISSNYFDTYDIPMAVGRSFEDNRVTDVNAIIVNEALAQKLKMSNYQDIVGRKLKIPYFGEYQDFEVIGVVKNYHHESVKSTIEPLVYFSVRNNGWCGRISVKLTDDREQQWKADADFIQNTFEKSFKQLLASVGWGVVSEARDVRSAYYEQYSSDRQFSTLITVLAFLAIIMAGIGFFGLASSTTRKRTREIAIRKINGARIQDVAILLIKYFLRLVGVAFVISLPISYMMTENWLEDFPVRTSIGPVFIFSPLIITLGLTIISVSYYILKVVFVNPIHILRNE